jgi:hypothetical protein
VVLHHTDVVWHLSSEQLDELVFDGTHYYIGIALRRTA